MTEHKATPGQWNADRYDWARADTEALDGNSAFRCIMELRSRVEALEAGLTTVSLELRDRVEALEAAAKPAESSYPELPNSSLVDLVTLQIDNGTACDRESARIARDAILEVAAWVDHLGYHSCAAELRKEVPQSC